MKIFLDIGANNGQTLKIALDRKYGFDQIWCFEPVQSCCDYLEKHFIDSRVVVYRFGLWNKTCKHKVFSPGTIKASIFADKRNVDRNKSDMCEFIRASDFFREHISAADIVYFKINCEGAECDVVDDLLDSGEFDKIHRAFISFDVHKIPSQKHREKEIRDRLGSFPDICYKEDDLFNGSIVPGARLEQWLQLIGEDLPPVGRKVRARRKELDYRYVTEDRLKVLQMFSLGKPVCAVRANDAEMYILRGQRKASYSFRVELAKSLQRADMVGLPRRYLHGQGRRHECDWDIEIQKTCQKLGVDIDIHGENVVSATMFYASPELLSLLTNNKKVLWVTFEAHKIPYLLENKDFRQYYGFENIESLFIDIPDGKGARMFNGNSLSKTRRSIRRQVERRSDFDIAVFGAGCMADSLCVFVRDKMGKSAIDVGAMLSAMKGQRNRNSLQKNGAVRDLVWIDK